MARQKRGPLTRREREVLDLLFELGNRASAEDVRVRLTDPPSYSAVRALLARLEQKGHVRHSVVGARYIYSATISPAAALRSVLQQHLRTFFGGSRSRMITALLREGDWTREELDALRGELDRMHANDPAITEGKKR